MGFLPHFLFPREELTYLRSPAPLSMGVLNFPSELMHAYTTHVYKDYNVIIEILSNKFSVKLSVRANV